MVTGVNELLDRYRTIGRERMRDLPIYNRRLEVEAVGFRAFQEHQLGVLITPWFMNLIMLPGTDDLSALAEGSVSEWSLPAGRHEFTTCRDDTLGTYLSAVLFRTMIDFPEQATAREVAREVLEKLFEAPAPRRQATADKTRSAAKSMSRRGLFSGPRAL